MKKLILLASAAALAFATGAAAKPGNGHSAGHGKHATSQHGATANHARTPSRGGIAADHHTGMYALDARGSCPPGLAKRHNGCMAPGQAKKLYNVGQRYNRNSGNLWSYNQIPETLRSQYGLDQSDRYYYNSGNIYQVDPRTMLVERVISAILR